MDTKTQQNTFHASDKAFQSLLDRAILNRQPVVRASTNGTSHSHSDEDPHTLRGQTIAAVDSDQPRENGQIRATQLLGLISTAQAYHTMMAIAPATFDSDDTSEQSRRSLSPRI